MEYFKVLLEYLPGMTDESHKQRVELTASSRVTKI